MKIAMVAGGTGGHIYPALTLADELKKRGHEIIFFGAKDRLEKKVVPQRGYELIAYDIHSTKGGLISKAHSALTMLITYFRAKKDLKGFDLVFGFGNYISLPIVKAAKSLKIKIVLHEQNSFLGKANKVLYKDCDLLIASYKESLEEIKGDKAIYIGNPQSSIAHLYHYDEKVLKDMGIDADKKVVTIFMGSLGSESVNKILREYFKLCADIDYEIIFATGDKEYAKFENEAYPHVHIFKRIDGARVMASSTLVITRSGASTIAEIIALHKAAILIPSPYVANNHQYHNAKALSDKGAALLLNEKELDAKVLKKTIEDLLKDEARQKLLSTNLEAFDTEDVNERIIKELEKLWK